MDLTPSEAWLIEIVRRHRDADMEIVVRDSVVVEVRRIIEHSRFYARRRGEGREGA